MIVADEFAALAKEIPEFMAGVVDIAARGRTLGLRLVLATQRPQGIVTPADPRQRLAPDCPAHARRA